LDTFDTFYKINDGNKESIRSTIVKILNSGLFRSLEEKYYGLFKKEEDDPVLNPQWCHQCKLKHIDIIYCCKNKDGICSKKYCKNCIMRHYSEDITELDRDTWNCYYCQTICKCAQCRRKRGEPVIIRKPAGKNPKKNTDRPNNDPPSKKRRINKKEENLQASKTKTIKDEDTYRIVQSPPSPQQLQSMNYFKKENTPPSSPKHVYSSNPTIQHQFVREDKGWHQFREDKKPDVYNYRDEKRSEVHLYPNYNLPFEYDNSHILVPLLFERSEIDIPFCLSTNYPLYKYEDNTFVENYQRYIF